MGKTQTFGKGNVEKERRKSLSRVYSEKKKFVEELDKLDGIDKLEYDINNIKAQIRNCEFDLKNPTLSERIINNKIKSLKEMLKLKEDKLKELKND